MAIILALMFPAFVDICHCAPCYAFMFEAEMYETFVNNIAEKKTALPKVLREA